MIAAPMSRVDRPFLGFVDGKRLSTDLWFQNSNSKLFLSHFIFSATITTPVKCLHDCPLRSPPHTLAFPSLPLPFLPFHGQLLTSVSNRSNFTFQESVLPPTELSRPRTMLPSKSTSPRLTKKAVPSQVNTSPTLCPATSEPEVKPTTL